MKKKEKKGNAWIDFSLVECSIIQNGSLALIDQSAKADLVQQSLNPAHAGGKWLEGER